MSVTHVPLHDFRLDMRLDMRLDLRFDLRPAE